MVATRPPGIEGRTLGEFVVVERLGAGGYGAVYRAEQPALGRDAVIKVLHERHRDRAETIQRFLREAKLASRLDHPYAAHVYAFGAEPDGLLWIAMERVRGTPLDAWLREHGRFPLDKLVPFVERLCEVVHTAHEQGIVHRDIKPANVMVLSRAGRLLPKLLDFGIAKAIDDVARDSIAVESDDTAPPSPITQDGRRLGSPLYMAPELWIDASSADARTDLYALAVTAYEALTGVPPYRGASVRDVALGHARGTPPPLGGEFPTELDPVFARALARDPGDRHATVLELAAAFRVASGIADGGAALPRLVDDLRDRAIAAAPQPIAEAISVLDAARGAHQALDAIVQVAATAVRYLALVALAARTRDAGAAPVPRVIELVRALRRRDLADREWLDLVRALVAPYATDPASHPIPPLVVATPAFADAMDAILALRPRIRHAAGISAPAARDLLAEVLQPLDDLIRALEPVFAYPLVVCRRGAAERWTGLRRSARPAVAATGLAENEVGVLDPAGRPALRLSPLAIPAEPSPGAAVELFLLDGEDRRGARFVAWPAGFEHHDDAVWDWLGATLPGADERADSDTLAVPTPYPGLTAFSRDDAGVFFGRERETEAVVNRLRTRAFLAVVGPSGAGKSSFVHAGVVPALPAGWRAITLRPGSTPMAVLERRLAIDDRGLLVVVIDQLEELFTVCRDPVERARFATTIAGMTSSAEDPIRVIVTLRDDFLVRAQALAWRDRFTDGVHILTTPGRDELLRIVVEPARRAGYDFDDSELPARMVDEVGDRPGALALLQFTAARLWDQRDTHFRQLTRRAYDAIGGVGGALARHAEATLRGLDATGQRLVREAFRHLVTAEGTRAPLERSDLIRVIGSETRADEIVERLVAARLVVATESDDGEDRIEIAHEALLVAWPRLVEWRREDAEGARLRDQLRAAARQWDERGRARGLLWRDDAVAEYRGWRRRHPGPLGAIDEAFADASLAHAARSRRVRRASVAAVLGMTTAAALVLFYLRQQAEGNRRDADSSRAAAQASERVATDRLRDNHREQGRRALLDGDSFTALVHFDEAKRLGDTGPALDMMVARALEPLNAELVTLRGHDAQLWSIAFDADASHILTAGDDGTARIWNVATGSESFRFGNHPRGLTVAGWSADGHRVVTGGVDGRVRVWRSSDGTLELELAGHRDPITDVAFDPAGRTIAAAAEDGHVKLWPMAGGEPVATMRVSAERGLHLLEFSPTSNRIVTSSVEGRPIVWTRDGLPRARLRADGDRIWFAVFAPRGNRIATTGFGGMARVWNAETGELIAASSAHVERITHIAFDRSGERVVTVSGDRTGKVWNFARDTAVTLRGHTAQINRVAFTPDDAGVVTVASDGTARLWDAARGTLLATFAHGGVVFDLAISDDGRRLATASWNGTAKVWDLSRRPVVARLEDAAIAWDDTQHGIARLIHDGRSVVRTGPRAAVVWDIATGRTRKLTIGVELRCASMDPSGRWLALTGSDGSVGVFDVDRDTPILSAELAARCATVPEVDRVVTIGNDGHLVTWDVGTGIRVARSSEKLAITRLAPATAGDVMLGYDPDAPVPAWSIRTDTLGVVAKLDGHTNPVLGSSSFSPDGAWLATTAEDPIVRIWSGRTGELVSELKHAGQAGALTWNARGDRLLVGSINGVATEWDVATWSPIRQFVGHGAFVSAVAYRADGKLIATASWDRTVRLWDAESGQVLFVYSTGEETPWSVTFDADGGRIVVSTLTHTSVWNVEAAMVNLAEVIRCRVPRRLVNGIVVDAEPDACTDPVSSTP